MMRWSLLLLLLAIWYGHCKPVKEVLPHTRDYYAGYIKAITDNFDQLFENERKTRSINEEDENNDAEDEYSPPEDESNEAPAIVQFNGQQLIAAQPGLETLPESPDVEPDEAFGRNNVPTLNNIGSDYDDNVYNDDNYDDDEDNDENRNENYRRNNVKKAPKRQYTGAYGGYGPSAYGMPAACNPMMSGYGMASMYKGECGGYGTGYNSPYGYGSYGSGYGNKYSYSAGYGGYGLGAGYGGYGTGARYGGYGTGAGYGGYGTGAGYGGYGLGGYGGYGTGAGYGGYGLGAGYGGYGTGAGYGGYGLGAGYGGYGLGGNGAGYGGYGAGYGGYGAGYGGYGAVYGGYDAGYGGYGNGYGGYGLSGGANNFGNYYPNNGHGLTLGFPQSSYGMTGYGNSALPSAGLNAAIPLKQIYPNPSPSTTFQKPKTRELIIEDDEDDDDDNDKNKKASRRGLPERRVVGGHHLHRLLVMPGNCVGDHCTTNFRVGHHRLGNYEFNGNWDLADCRQGDCGGFGHGFGYECGPFGCGVGVHNIHAEPIGCSGYNSPFSPCLPHGNFVAFGHPQKFHTRHPVLLHPAFQETAHHNIHNIGRIQGPGFSSGIYGNGGLVHQDLITLPHYGHRCCGKAGWNPYWGF